MNNTLRQLLQMVLLLLFSIFITNAQSSKKYLEEKQIEVARKIGEVSELKGKHIWNTEYKGKNVKWSGSVWMVKDLRDEPFSNNDNIELTLKPIEFSLASDVFVSAVFTRKWLRRLRKYDIGEIVTIEGILSDYDVWAAGIAPSVFITISKSKIVEE